ncbi:hypothetical protein ACLOJK_016888 [Asimina triloba]
MEKMNKAMEKVKMLVGVEVEQEEELPNGGMFSFVDDFNRDCTLSTTQRMYGFAICLVSGLACTLLSMLVFFNPVKFGITFTFGNLLALGSTAFLIGPKRQVTMMMDPVRIYATAIYMASMIIALFCAFYVSLTNPSAFLCFQAQSLPPLTMFNDMFDPSKQVWFELHPVCKGDGFKSHARLFRHRVLEATFSARVSLAAVTAWAQVERPFWIPILQAVAVDSLKDEDLR